MAQLAEYDQDTASVRFKWQDQVFTLDQLLQHIQSAGEKKRENVVEALESKFDGHDHEVAKLAMVRDEIGYVLSEIGNHRFVWSDEEPIPITTEKDRADAKRVRVQTARKTCNAYFDSDELIEFLLKKYPQRTSSENWWKRLNASVEKIISTKGSVNTSVNDLKKAWSDAILKEVQSGRSELELQARHLDSSSLEPNPGSIPLDVYQRHGHGIGQDGMIEKLAKSGSRNRGK